MSTEDRGKLQAWHDPGSKAACFLSFSQFHFSCGFIPRQTLPSHSSHAAGHSFSCFSNPRKEKDWAGGNNVSSTQRRRAAPSVGPTLIG